MDAELPGQANIPMNGVLVIHCSEEDIPVFGDELLQFVRDNFSNTSTSVVSKESAREFIKDSLPQSNFSFHLQSVQGAFISWERADPRVLAKRF